MGVVAVSFNSFLIFSNNSGERAVVIVREGYGAIGLKDAWTAEEIKAGKIPFHVARFTPEEAKIFRNDRTITKFPPITFPERE